MTVLELLKQGGISLIPLGICSILVIAVVLERMWALSRIGSVPQELIRRVENLLSAGKWHEAVELLDNLNSPFARVAKAGVLRRKASMEEVTDILILACDAEVAAAARPLPVIGTIGNIAPFIGLFGTVIGIMKAFHSVSRTGSADSNVVSGGIAEALIATAVGLGIGIVAVVANNWFQSWVEGYRHRLERFATEWSYRLADMRETESKVPEEAVV